MNTPPALRSCFHPYTFLHSKLQWPSPSPPSSSSTLSLSPGCTLLFGVLICAIFSRLPPLTLPHPHFHQTSSCLWSPSQDERRRERGRAAERCVLFVCLLVRSVMCAAHKPLKPQRQQRHPVFPAVCLPLCRRRSLYPPTTLDVACRLVPQPFVAFWTSHPHSHAHSDTP